MQEIITSIKAYLYDRSASPLLGSLIIGWSAWNYNFFIILFSSGLPNPSEKFTAIEKLFSPYTLTYSDTSILISSKIIDGALFPVIIAALYLYVYPFLAKPVYEHSLKKQKELKAVKQAIDDQRLLSVEESREIYRHMAMMQKKHQDEIESLNNQNAALNQYIERLEKNDIKKPTADSKIIDSEADDTTGAELSQYDAQIAKAIEMRDTGNFHLNELFGQKEWLKIPITQRQALGKQLKHQVDRGDFIGVRSTRKDSGNQQIFFKSH